MYAFEKPVIEDVALVPACRLLFLRSNDITVSTIPYSRFSLVLDRALEGYKTLTVLACSIQQIYTTDLQYLTISIAETNNTTSTTASNSTSYFPSPHFILPLLPAGVKTAATIATYQPIGSVHHKIYITGQTIQDLTITLMDENLKPLTPTTASNPNWTFYLLLQAE